MQQCRELLSMRDLWGQAEAAAPSAAAELKQLTGIMAGVEASCRCATGPSHAACEPTVCAVLIESLAGGFSVRTSWLHSWQRMTCHSVCAADWQML